MLSWVKTNLHSVASSGKKDISSLTCYWETSPRANVYDEETPCLPRPVPWREWEEEAPVGLSAWQEKRKKNKQHLIFLAPFCPSPGVKSTSHPSLLYLLRWVSDAWRLAPDSGCHSSGVIPGPMSRREKQNGCWLALAPKRASMQGLGVREEMKKGQLGTHSHVMLKMDLWLSGVCRKNPYATVC